MVDMGKLGSADTAVTAAMLGFYIRKTACDLIRLKFTGFPIQSNPVHFRQVKFSRVFL